MYTCMGLHGYKFHLESLHVSGSKYNSKVQRTFPGIYIYCFSSIIILWVDHKECNAKLKEQIIF